MSLAAIAVLVLVALVAFVVIGFVLKLIFWAVVALLVVGGAGWLWRRVARPT